MKCKKCDRDIPDDALFCCYCGKELNPKRKGTRRGNGQGQIYKRYGKWTALKSVYADGCRKTTSKGGFATKREAEDWLKGATVIKKHRDSRIAFKDLYEKFIERHSDRVSHSTMNCYKAAYKFFSPLYNLAYADITTEDFQECVDACPKGKRTKQNMKALGTLLDKYAMEQKVIDKGFAQFVWIGEGECDSRVPFTQEQVELLIDVAEMWDMDAALIAIDCCTGFRPSELFALKHEDLKDGVLTGGSKTDKGRNRQVPVSPRIAGLVKRFADQDTDILFCTDKVWNVATWRENSFYKTLDRLGIQKESDHTLTPYSCRHYYATRLKQIETGAALDKSALMGHTSPTMTEHYQHSNIAELRAIMEQF